jgi:hypothetical protein
MKTTILKIAKVLDNHLEGKTTNLSKRIFAEIVNKAIKSGFNGPFKVIRIAISNNGFDFYQVRSNKNMWEGTYREGVDFYKAEVKKTESGTTIWKIVDKEGVQVGWGSFLPDETYRPAKEYSWRSQDSMESFDRQYPLEVQECFKAANNRLFELISEQNFSNKV